MSSPDLRLREATVRDLPEMASVHLKSYSERHFTSRLPSALLVDYYRHFLSGGSEALVISGGDGDCEKIIGFAVFGRGIGDKIAQFKRKNRLGIIRTAAGNPFAAISKVLRQRWTRITQGRPGASSEYLLLSIAVVRPRLGAGGLLLDAFLERARRSGAKTAGLYVNADNIAALNAYVTKGFLIRELYGDQFYMERDI